MRGSPCVRRRRLLRLSRADSNAAVLHAANRNRGNIGEQARRYRRTCSLDSVEAGPFNTELICEWDEDHEAIRIRQFWKPGRAGWIFDPTNVYQRRGPGVPEQEY